jgi:hypothetical protein
MSALLESVFQRAKELGIIDDIADVNGSITLTSGAKKLTVEESMPSEGKSYLLWSSAAPEQVYEVVGVKAEPAVVRLVLQYFMGLTSGRFQGRVYSNALFVPVETAADGLVLGTADGSRYVLSHDAGGNVGNISLGFYNLVYDNNGEHWVMSLPGLYPRDKYSISTVKSSYVPISMEGCMAELPASLDALTFCPRTECVPVTGISIMSNVIVTSSEGKVITDMNRTLHTFLSGTETPGYTAIREPDVQVHHQDISKEVIKSDVFRVKALDNGSLQLNCMRAAGGKDVYSSFVAHTNVYKAETYLNAAGYALRDLKSGVDLSGMAEAKKLKEFLVSSAKFTVPDQPVIERKFSSRGLTGELAMRRLGELGFDTSLGVLSSVRQLAVGVDLPEIAKPE